MHIYIHILHTLHYITLHYITLHYITLHYITLHYITLHYITLHYITLHYITLHYITLHYITLHYITLHYITLHYITLHYITYIHYIHTFVHTYIHAYIHTYIHRYIDVHIDIHKKHICTYMWLCGRLWHHIMGRDSAWRGRRAQGLGFLKALGSSTQLSSLFGVQAKKGRFLPARYAVEPHKVEHGCWMIYTGSRSFFGFRLEGGHVPKLSGFYSHGPSGEQNHDSFFVFVFFGRSLGSWPPAKHRSSAASPQHPP